MSHRGEREDPTPKDILPGMLLEFRKAQLPQDAVALWNLDVAIFGKDAFDQALWLVLESYWVLVDTHIAGCAAFIHHADFQEDLREDAQNTPQAGSLYIQSTGLLPQYRGEGLGTRIKAWQIEYAKQNRFRRIVTNCRESNAAMISVNKKFGFKPIRTTPEYYEDGEATVVLELLLP
jgi:ribosomal protein S18 acetylase RimI-like enzyme